MVDFDHLENYKEIFQDIECGFCCLGTTRAASGAVKICSVFIFLNKITCFVCFVLKEGFVKVDHDYVVNTAKVAHESGCKRFSIITAENANKDSFFLYPQTKVGTNWYCNFFFLRHLFSAGLG